MAIEAVASASATLAVILAVNNSLVAEVLARFGSHAQQRRWLLPLATGRVVGAFALSEVNAGTDAAHQEINFLFGIKEMQRSPNAGRVSDLAHHQTMVLP